jgi:hypothetical protein
LALPFIAAFVIIRGIIQVACEVAANRKRRRYMTNLNLTIADREAIVKIAAVSGYMASHNKPELAVALAVYVAERLGHPVDAIALCADMTALGEAEKSEG